MSSDNNEVTNTADKMAANTQQAMQQGSQVAKDMTERGSQVAKDMTERGAQAARDMTQKSAQAAQEMSQKGMQSAQEMGRAAQDMGRKTTEGAMAGMAEFGRMFSEMRFPGMPDMDAFLATHRRNMEALSSANRVALEGAQTVAKRHMEIVQQTMQEMSETIRDLTSADNPQVRATKQAEMVKGAYERAVTHMRELADLIQRSNGEALQMLNQRFAEAMDEVKAIADKSAQKSA